MNHFERPQLWLSCIQQGFVAILPVVLLGALALTLAQIPVYFPQMSQSPFFEIVSVLERATYGVLALVLVLSISFQLARVYRKRDDLAIDELIVATGAGITLVAITYMNTGYQEGINFGFPHIIHALIIGIVFTELMVLWFKLSGDRFSYLEYEVSGQLSLVLRMVFPFLLLPVLMVTGYYFLFLDVSILAPAITWFVGDVNGDVGMTTWQSIRLVLINQVFWFIGIHGSSIIASAGDLVLINHNVFNFNAQIINHYAYIGGSGCTLGLVLALFLSRRSSHRRFAKYAILPGLFNINELIIFGLPLVLNRFLLLPFLFVPLIVIGLIQGFLALDWIEFTNQKVNWSMPFLLGGYLLAGHWSGAALQLLVCILSAGMYWPFLKRFERHQAQQQAFALEKMITRVSSPDFDVNQVISSTSETGAFCRGLAKDISDFNGFEMHYQPKVNGKGQVFGAEALIRWHHPEHGTLSPSLFIPIAEASGQIHALGHWIIERCFKDMKIMARSYGFKVIPISINVSPIQLSRSDFIPQLKRQIVSYGIEPSFIELEITEGQKLKLTDTLVAELQQLASMGLSIAVDDFGMGHTSLHYLKSFPVHTIKIDGDIIRDVASSAVIKEMVQSMGQLAHGMNAKLVAEWVEREEQLLALQLLGCDEYQGSYFSMPLPLPELVAYCVAHQRNDE